MANIRGKLLSTGEEVEFSDTDIISIETWKRTMKCHPPEHEFNVEEKTGDGRIAVKKKEIDISSFYRP